MLRSDGSDAQGDPLAVSPAGLADLLLASGGADAASPAMLARMVEGEIIPRLLVSCRGTSQQMSVPRPDAPLIRERDIDRLASAAIREDSALLMGQIEAQLARGLSTESILIDVMAPAARLLGEWWEQDACDFIDVTMGLWRLQEAVHELLGRQAVSTADPGNCRAALFAVAPGDQHGFGSVVVEEVFRRAGWACEGRRSASLDDLMALVRGVRFDLVALTASNDQHAAELTAVIADMRVASRNPNSIFMVGGAVFNNDPTLASRVGADASAPDARSALVLADALLQEQYLRPASAVSAG